MVITARAYAIATSYFHEKTPILKLSGAALIWGRRLKEGEANVKERRIMQMKFYNLVIVSFQITMSSCYYDIYSHIFHND